MENRNQARNRQRLKAKIKKWLNTYKCIFITLTFNNETLETTTEEERAELVKKFLKKNTALYIANKDYGANNDREHYHALAVVSTITKEEIKDADLIAIKDRLNYDAWKYGLIKANFIGSKYRPKNDNGFKTTSDYIAHHFYKETTKGAKVIYSRGEPMKSEQINRLKTYRDALNIKENNKLEEMINRIIADAKQYGYEMSREEAENTAINEIEYNDYYEDLKHIEILKKHQNKHIIKTL